MIVAGPVIEADMSPELYLEPIPIRGDSELGAKIGLSEIDLPSAFYIG